MNDISLVGIYGWPVMRYLLFFVDDMEVPSIETMSLFNSGKKHCTNPMFGVPC